MSLPVEMGKCEAVGVWACHLPGPWESAGLGRVRLCANDMCWTPTSLCPATLLHPPRFACSSRRWPGALFASKSRSQLLALHLHGRQTHDRPFECHVHASCTFIFALLFELQSRIIHSAPSFRLTTCRLPATSRTTVLFPPHSLFAQSAR